jgi:uncharacterized membrane protein YphA (DoxX/SURF4 family)
MKFSLLNLISGFLETGVIIFALGTHGIEVALIAALLYQLGNLVPYPVRISRRIAVGFSVTACILMIAGLFFPLASVISVVFLSAALQSVRAQMKTSQNKIPKRFVRTMGFLLGFLFVPISGVICAIVVCLYAVLTGTSEPDSENPAKTKIKLPKFRRMHTLMVVHQMHYFVYCYSIIIIAYDYGGALCAAGLFFAGWLLYVYAPKLRPYKGSNYYRIFYVGHWLLIGIMLTMYLTPTMPIALAVLWILTGLGGTTEFCIGKLEEQHGEHDEYTRCCSENYGHVFGVLACMAIYVITGNLMYTILASPIFAAVAIALMVSAQKKERSKNESHGN